MTFSVETQVGAGEREISEQLRKWMSWTQRSQIPAFRQLREKIGRHFSSIIASAKHKLSNARMEPINTKIKRVIRKAYGFRPPWQPYGYGDAHLFRHQYLPPQPCRPPLNKDLPEKRRF